MLTIHLNLVNHKLLSKLRIYENIWIKDLVAIQLVFWFLQYRTRPEYSEQKHFLSVPGHIGHVLYCKYQNTNRIATESLIHIFSYILNLLRSLWFTKSKWIVRISLNSNLNMALLLRVGQNRKLTPKFLIE